MDKKKFGQFVRESRLAKGYTQQEFADMLMIDVSAVSKWERGVSYPDITMIPDISAHLGVSIEELIESSKDTEYRRIKKEASSYNKLKKTLFIVLEACFIVALLTCFICNLAVDHTLDWFFIVLFSLLLGNYALMFPFYNRWFKLKKFSLLCYFSGSMLLTILLLLCINSYSSFNIGGSILVTLYCFSIAIGISLVHLLKINPFYRTSIDLVLSSAYLFGLFYTLTWFLEVDQSLKIDFNDWTNYSNGNTGLIIVFTFTILAIVFFIVGKLKKED